MSLTPTQYDAVTTTDRFLEVCESAWPECWPRPRVLTRAPGRLDCMGGMASDSGGLALQRPIDRCAYVAAGPRQDQRIAVRWLKGIGDGPSGTSDSPTPSASHEWPLSAFYQSNGQLTAPDELVRRVPECDGAHLVAGMCWSLLASRDLPHLSGGVNLLIDCDIPRGRGLASSSAIQIAVAQALTALADIDLPAARLLHACHTTNVALAGRSCGTGAPCGTGSSANLIEPVACLLGEPESLLQVQGHDGAVLGPLLLPRDVTFAAVDSGPRSDLCGRRYEDNRTASLLGWWLIEQLAPTGSPPGCLSGISPNDYVSRLRGELPVKMRGRDFAASYGLPPCLKGGGSTSSSPGAPASLVPVRFDPQQVYKIRSRTEHHIYENDRAHRLVERLSRARRTGERDALVEAGELLYASHWSYSQRCGLGSLEADVLVNEIRSRGPARGLYGAKITGMGCGGTVAVLMSCATSARAALEEACESYAARTGRTPTLMTGSSPGAHSFGRRYLD